MVTKVGNLRLFCSGKIVVGPDWKAVVVTFLLIGVPSVLFLALIAPDIGEEICWISVLLVLFVLAMLFCTAFSNPGIVPRQSLPADAGNDTRFLPFPKTKNFQINGYRVTTKYCTTCHVYRLPRCSHCAMCDNCVEKFDHYCPWVGTSIGRRNYRYFLMFVLSATLLCIYVFTLSLVRLIKLSDEDHRSFDDAIKKEPVAIALIVYTFIAAWFVGGLSVFHLYLVVTNQTTYEHFRKRFGPNGNPYDKGFPRNIFEACCELRTPYGWEGDSAVAETNLGTEQRQAIRLSSSFLKDVALAPIDKLSTRPEPPSSNRTNSVRASSQSSPCGLLVTGVTNPCRSTLTKGEGADGVSIDYQDSIYTTASSNLEEHLAARAHAMTNQSIHSVHSSFLLDIESVGSSCQHMEGSPTTVVPSNLTGLASEAAEDPSSSEEEENENNNVRSDVMQGPANSSRELNQSKEEVGMSEDAGVPSTSGDSDRGRSGVSKFKLRPLRLHSRGHYDELKEGPEGSREDAAHGPPPKPPLVTSEAAMRGPSPTSSTGESAPRPSSSPKPARTVGGMVAGLNIRQRYTELVEELDPQVSAVSETQSSETSVPSVARSSSELPAVQHFPARVLGAAMRSLGRSTAQGSRLSFDQGPIHNRSESQDAVTSFTEDGDETGEEMGQEFPVDAEGIEGIGEEALVL